MSSIVYASTNTALQVLDTFDLPTTKTIHCEVHALDRNESSVSELVINHNGIEISEIQTAISVSGNQPAEITTDIANNVGRILIAPTVAPTQYSITQNVVECNLYSENTVSGRLINADEGIGIYFANNANNMSIRQSNNNFFGYVNTYLTVDTLGPVTTKQELYQFDNFNSYNDSSIDIVNTDIIITATGQAKNNNYLELNVTPYVIYRVAYTGSYTFDPVYANEDSYDIGTRLAIGTSVAKQDIVYREFTKTETGYVVDFVPTSNTVYVGLGFGALGSILNISSFSIKELVPFHTYDQLQGTFYTSWDAVTAPNNLLVMGNNTLKVDASNNIFINTVNCGPQQAVNRLAFTYGNTQIAHAVNGANVVTQSATYYSTVQSTTINTNVNEFSYVPVNLSNTTLIGLTNG